MNEEPETEHEEISGDFDALVLRLSIRAEKQNLVSRANEGLVECFKNEGGKIMGWAYDDIRAEFYSHSLHFKNVWLNYPYIITHLRLSAGDSTEIGNYQLVTLPNGEVDDDYLNIDISQEELAILPHSSRST